MKATMEFAATWTRCNRDAKIIGPICNQLCRAGKEDRQTAPSGAVFVDAERPLLAAIAAGQTLPCPGD